MNFAQQHLWLKHKVKWLNKEGELVLSKSFEVAQAIALKIRCSKVEEATTDLPLQSNTKSVLH